MSLQIPKEISALEAVRIIAQVSTRNRAVGENYVHMSKPEIVTLARVACRTEGVSFGRAGAQPGKPAP